MRGVAQRCPYPRMKNLVTLGAQHQGVYGFPGCRDESETLCNVMRELLSYGAYNDVVQDILVQAQYWHDPLHHATYAENSQFSVEITNEGEIKNETYATNLMALDNFVMVQFDQVLYHY